MAILLAEAKKLAQTYADQSPTVDLALSRLNSKLEAQRLRLEGLSAAEKETVNAEMSLAFAAGVLIEINR